MSIKKILNSNTQISLNKATRLLDVSRFGFYKWESRQENGFPSLKDEMKLRDEIQNIAVEFPRYGYRRITAELRNRGMKTNHKKVLWLMREDNLLCVKKKFKPITTNSNHNLKKYPNLIKNLEIKRTDQVWASDITYIQLLKEFVYLSVILDLFTRRCIGWDLSRNIDSNLTLNALHKAINSRWNEKLRGRTIHHSDQGVQYASHEYIQSLLDHGIKVSMSSKGNPYEKAFAESFIKTIKYEEVYLNEYESFEDALMNIHEFIEEVYNKKRLHSSLGYRSPNDFELQLNINSVA